jgi:CRP-like cAMP-binding protein
VRRQVRPETLLARLPLFQGLGAEALARLAAATTRRELRRGEVLFREGEPSSGLHALVYGSIKLAARSGAGERVIDIVTPGRSFGEPVMFMEKPYIVTASALADSLVLHVAREAVFDELERNPRFARRALGALSERAESLVRQLEARAAGPAAHRLVAWMLRQPSSRTQGEADITLPGAKRAFASQLNLSAEHLSRVLRQLSERGLVEVHGRRLHVPDVRRLRSRYEH